MNRIYRDVTVLSLISGVATACLAPPAYSPPAGEPVSPYAANPPYWYFDAPAAPISPYSGQPYGYDPQVAALPYTGQRFAYAAQPAAPVTYATRRYGDANYGGPAWAGGPHPCMVAIMCR